MTRVLVDTSVWIDHLRSADPALITLLDRGSILTHPMIVGELALGSLNHRGTVLTLLDDLLRARQATHDEVRVLIEQRTLHGTGLGLVDATVLASTLVTPDSRLWTRDRRLASAARAAGVAWRGGDHRS